ncbi:MAG: S-layer homology domain-containing protein, partial [Oscillospiraceae bacterium]
NNTASVQLDSLLHRAGEPVTITVAQSLTEDGKTKADITVRNNSLSGASSGNLVVNLLDRSGNVLETQQSYQPLGRAISHGLLSLTGEESETVDFTFSQPGASVKATYGALVLDDETNAELTSLSATGIPVRLADFKVDPDDATKFTATVSTAAGKTLVTALTKDPGAAVTVNGAPMPQGGTSLALSTGENKITIVITARDGVTKRTYEILAERTTSDPNIAPNTYVIIATAGPGGSIAPRGTSRVSRGGNKTYTITPDKGYAISDVLVDGVSAGKVSNYTFEKVRARHTIEAHFAPMELVFKDVAEKDWFYSAVQFVAKENLMGGVGDDRFNPLGNSSRATVATVLYRMAGSPAVTGTPGFGDVPTDQWHSNAIAWAAENGVAQGNGKKFAPDDDVTREQLAQLFYNYAKLKKYDMTPAGDLSKFTDAPTGWSRDAMAWAVGCGIITGKG